MIERLRAAAAKLRMNKVEVAGFSTAIKEASAVPCAGAGGSRRTMASAELGGSLDLVSGLVGTSKEVGLEGLAAKGMGHSLSSALGSMSEINKARRSVRRALRYGYRQINQHLSSVALSSTTGTSSAMDEAYPFQRRDPLEYVVEDGMWDGRDEQGTGWGGRRVSARRTGNSDVLLDTLSGLSASQLGGAVEGEDSAAVDSPLIKMSSKRSSPDALNGATIAPAGGPTAPAFGLPKGLMSQSRRTSSGSVDVQATGMGESPFDADSELGGGVASLGLSGTVVSDLSEPVVLEMPGGRNGSASLELFTPTGELLDTFDGKVDTCQYWNFATNGWDGRGCIAIGSDAVSGKLQCHCYHLTDFGGVASDAIPKMSMPDPTNPAAAFKNISADDITVILTLGILLLTYWALCYWGWQKDRQEAKQAAAGLLNPSPEQHRKRKEEQEADELDSAVNANNAELTRRLMRGSLLHKVMAIRRQLWQQFSTKHKLLGGFFAVNSNFTRPRRFTVLFCMLMGNMFVNALFIGSGTQETFIQKILAGVLAAIIMFPASFFFAWIFKNLEISPDRQRVRDQRAAASKAHDVQQVVDELGAGSKISGPEGRVIAAPSSKLAKPPPRRNWVPAPDIQRMGPGKQPLLSSGWDV